MEMKRAIGSTLPRARFAFPLRKVCCYQHRIPNLTGGSRWIQPLGRLRGEGWAKHPPPAVGGIAVVSLSSARIRNGHRRYLPQRETS